MDRIQKALDKAKANYASKMSVENGNSPRQKLLTEETVSNDFENIAYTKTKVVDVSLEDLALNRIIAGQYNNPQSGVFRMLRTQVLQKMRANNWKTLAITSPTAGEGKSLIASNLAVAMAMESNQTVLLVDLDLRHPRLSKYFNLKTEVGIKDYLEGDLNLSDVLVNPSIKRLVMLPGKGRAEDSAELLSSPKMTSLAADLKAQYDSRMIIFDMPPILQTDDVLLASNYIDCTLLVVEDGKNKESEIVKSLQMLDSKRLLGTVLNKSEKPPLHQSY